MPSLFHARLPVPLKLTAWGLALCALAHSAAASQLEKPLMAEFALSQGNQTQARSLYASAALELGSDALLKRSLGLGLGDPELEAQGLELTQAFVRSYPDHIPAWFYQAHLAFKLNRYELAATTLNQILSIDPNANLEQIVEGVGPKTAEERELLLGALAQIRTQNPSVLLLRSSVLAQSKQLEAALAVSNQALQANPNALALILHHARLLAEKDPKRAADFLVDQHYNNKSSTSILLQAVRMQLRLKDNKAAYAFLKHGVKDYPYDSEVWLLASLVAIDLDKHKQAQRWLTSMIERKMLTHQAQFYLGVSLQKQGKFNQAKAQFSELRGTDLASEALKRLIAIHLTQRDTQAAVAAAKALEQDPEFYELAQQILTKLGQSSEPAGSTHAHTHESDSSAHMH